MTDPYGWAHKQRRKHLILALVDHHTRTGIWKTCPRCDQTMAPDPLLPHDGLDLGHSDPEAKKAGRPGDRLEHSACNRSAGDGSRTPADWTSVDW